jgi:hypothetical protein
VRDGNREDYRMRLLRKQQRVSGIIPVANGYYKLELQVACGGEK